MNLGIGLLAVGLLLAFGFFVFGVLNMTKHMSNVASGGSDDFGAMFKRHAVVMIGMASAAVIMIGGVLTLLAGLLGP